MNWAVKLIFGDEDNYKSVQRGHQLHDNAVASDVSFERCFELMTASERRDLQAWIEWLYPREEDAPPIDTSEWEMMIYGEVCYYHDPLDD